MAKAIPTDTLINQLERLTIRLSEIVERDFPPLADEQLNWKELNEHWSIAECLLHLNLISDFYFPKILKVFEKTNTSNTKPSSTYLHGWLGNRISKGVRLSRNNRTKKLSESPVKFNPKIQDIAPINAQEVIKNFLKNQDDLLQFIIQSKTVNIQKICVPIGFLGLFRIQLGDMLKIIVYHTERHIVQAQRLLYNDNFPDIQLLETLTETN